MAAIFIPLAISVVVALFCGNPPVIGANGTVLNTTETIQRHE